MALFWPVLYCYGAVGQYHFTLEMDNLIQQATITRIKLGRKSIEELCIRYLQLMVCPFSVPYSMKQLSADIVSIQLYAFTVAAHLLYYKLPGCLFSSLPACSCEPVASILRQPLMKWIVYQQ